MVKQPLMASDKFTSWKRLVFSAIALHVYHDSADIHVPDENTSYGENKSKGLTFKHVDFAANVSLFDDEAPRFIGFRVHAVDNFTDLRRLQVLHKIIVQNSSLNELPRSANNQNSCVQYDASQPNKPFIIMHMNNIHREFLKLKNVQKRQHNHTI